MKEKNKENKKCEETDFQREILSRENPPFIFNEDRKIVDIIASENNYIRQILRYKTR